MKPSRSYLRPLLLILLATMTQVAGAAAQELSEEAEASSAAVRAVRFHVEPSQTRVWFLTTGAVLYTHYSPDPLTLVIDLPGVDVSALPERTVIGSREVEAILATRLEGVGGRRLSRIEIKLATIAPYHITGSEQALNVTFDSGEAPEPESMRPLAALEPAAQSEPTEDPIELVEAPVQAATLDDVEEIAAAPVAEIREKPIAPPPFERFKSHPASAISSISHELLGDILTVRLAADGQLNYTSFTLDGPRRLVFDFNGILNAVPRAALTVEELGVARIRVAQFRSANPRITRIVFDLDDEVTHRTSDQKEGLEIAFAASEASFAPTRDSSQEDAQDLAASQSFAMEAPPELETLPDTIPENIPDNIKDTTDTVASLMADSESAYLVRDASLSSEDGGSFRPAALTAQDFSLADPAPMLPVPPPLQDTGSSVADRVPDMVAGQSTEATQYTGELISLDFKDGDIQDIFRLFAEISGLNIVVQPGVAGRITLRLTEVPWDQALELILKTNRLGYIVEGNVIRIAPLSELAAEETEKRRLAEEKALAGDLFTNTRVLSYAKASDIQPLLQRNLSARGDIVIDERTNTVIFTDLEDQVADINLLIDTLDTPIPGVEIEARIIVTTRTFERQLGVQWGFTSNQTQELGNTTELTFPNRVQFDGQSIGSSSDQQFNASAAGGGLVPPTFIEGATAVQRGYAVNLPFAGSPTGAVGLSLGSITGAFSIDAAISAAERRGQVRVISAPKIITQNNQTAEIKQGTTFPVQVVANNTITVQFKDAVLELNVTPQITSANTIILDIEVNNDIPDFSSPVNGIPSIRTQSATTQVLMADGETTVIGGVFVNTQTTAEQYVPLLHRIPILGYLFKSQESENMNEELLIFLTPRIRKDAV